MLAAIKSGFGAGCGVVLLCLVLLVGCVGCVVLSALIAGA